MEVDAITGRIVLDENPALKAEKAVSEGARQMRNEVMGQNNQAMREMKEGWEGTLANFKEQFGRRSVLGESLELLAGGGVVAGIGMGAKTIADTAEKIGELADKARSGRESFRELAGESLRSLPVFGEVMRAVDGIREAITGEEAAEKRVIDIMQGEIRAHEEASRVIRARINETKSLGDEVKSLVDKLALLNNPTLALQIDFDTTVKDLKAKAGGFLPVADREGGTAEGIAALNRDINDNRAKLAAAQDHLRELQDNPPAKSPTEWDGRYDLVGGFQLAGGELKDAMGVKDAYEENLAKTHAQVGQLQDTLAREIATRNEGIKYQEGVNDALAIREKLTMNNNAKELDQRAKGLEDAGKLALEARRGYDADHRVQFEEMPSAVLPAEEIQGARVASGLPEFRQAQEEQTRALKDNAEALDRNSQALSGHGGLMAPIAIMGGF